jgi:hypothetical protein
MINKQKSILELTSKKSQNNENLSFYDSVLKINDSIPRSRNPGVPFG